MWVSMFAIAFSMYICLFPDIVRQWNKLMESKTGDEEVRTMLCVPPSLHSTLWEEGLRADSAVIWAGRKPGSLLLPPMHKHPRNPCSSLGAWQMMLEKTVLIETKDSVC